MLKDYIPVLSHALVAIAFAFITLSLSFLVGKAGARSRTKDAAYECGVFSEEKPQTRFSVKFYLLAMLFILFDIEIIFLYPWAVVFQRVVAQFGPEIFWSCFSFVGILLVGFFYALRKGALDWSR